MAAGSRRVVWTSGAQRDLDEIVGFLSEQSLGAARRALDAVLHSVASLERMAERGRIVPELDEASIREVFVYSYRVMFRVTEADVQLVAIVHGARDFERYVRRP